MREFLYLGKAIVYVLLRLPDLDKEEHGKAGTKEKVEEEVERKRLEDPDKEEHDKAGSEEEVESGRAGAARGCPASVDLFYVCAGILDACAEFFGVGPSLLGPVLDISKYSIDVAQAVRKSTFPVEAIDLKMQNQILKQFLFSVRCLRIPEPG